jgi:hypothetical protein
MNLELFLNGHGEKVILPLFLIKSNIIICNDGLANRLDRIGYDRIGEK